MALDPGEQSNYCTDIVLQELTKVFGTLDWQGKLGEM